MATDYDKILDNIGKIEARQREIRTRQTEINRLQKELGDEENGLKDEENGLRKAWSHYRREPWICPVCKVKLTLGQKNSHMGNVHNLAGKDITVQE